MPFPASCCCPRHDEWKHGDVDSDNLRQCSRKEAEMLDFASNDPKNKKRKRKICIYCRSRLEVEAKCSKLEVSLRSVTRLQNLLGLRCNFLYQDYTNANSSFQAFLFLYHGHCSMEIPPL